ncbi:MAG: hypothetical protein JWP03_2356 [Phycisphaerales bacterium]|nr:hypothetical protein [Phycisphaerales bacterium]
MPSKNWFRIPSWLGRPAHERAIVVQAFSLLLTQAESLHHKSRGRRAGRGSTELAEVPCHENSQSIFKPLSRTARILAASLLGATFVAGCQSVRVHDPLPAGWSDNDAHARTEFWYRLAARPVATNDEAFHAVLLYLDNTDACVDYAARVKTLQGRKMLPTDFHQASDEAVGRGTLAVALVRALKIEGGATMQLFGATPRYAVRALEYRGIYPPSSPNQGVSGGALVGIMQKAEEFEHGSPADAPAAFLPADIHHPGGPLAAAARKSESAANAQSSSPANGASGIVDTYFSVVPAEAYALNLLPASTRAIYLDVDATTDFSSVANADAYEDFDAAGSPAARRSPLYLADAPDQPAAPAAPAGPRHLNVIVTGVEGDSAEVRKSETDPWVRAKAGMVLHEEAEFRTGPKSAVRFIIPPDQTFCLDSQGTTQVRQAVAEGKKMKTDIALSHGRMRYDVAPIAAATGGGAGEPVRIEQAGLEHDAAIRSPNSALALRGTKVSLFEQSEFDPEAISLTGRAIYVNTLGWRVPFGGARRAAVHGSQTSAVQQAAASAEALQSPDLARTDFENRELSVVIQRGGFIRGDVVVGNLHLSDFGKLPGALDFVLQWNGGQQAALNDLNLAVFSPRNTQTSPDFVANPPFTVSLTPGSPASEQIRAASYPRTSKSGGAISKNSVGPDGLELASWGKNYPVGTYRVVVYNFLDASPPPTQTTSPVTYTIDVLLNGKKVITTFTGSVGFLQTSPAIAISVPATTAAAQHPASAVKPAVPRPTVLRVEKDVKPAAPARPAK